MDDSSAMSGGNGRAERAKEPASSEKLPPNRCVLETRKAPRPLLISGPASPITPSWNQVVGFLTDWEGLRRMAA